ncbi:MAG: hypothetical protein ACLP6G_13715 [Terriglobales bacterium]
MRQELVRRGLTVAWGMLLLLGTLPSSAAQTAPAQDSCKASYALKPLDENVVTLLGDTVVPSKQAAFVDPRLLQLQALDFPSKVTAWADRPAPEEMARRRAALRVSSAGGNGVAAGVSQPYVLRTFPDKDFADLEKWFAKEAPKKVPDLCVDPATAGYVLAIGVIADGGGAGGKDNALARTQYDQSVTRQADRAVGPNSGTFTPGGGGRPADELSGLDSSGSGIHTCVYLYRTNGPGGTRREMPDYYYCHSGDNLPKSAVTTMLKYISKNGVK